MVEIHSNVRDAPIFNSLFAEMAGDFFHSEEVWFGADALVDSGP